MRKTNIALLAAVVMTSPIAFADGYDSYPSNSDDIVIDGSKNDIYKSSLDLDVNKTATIKNVGNTDNDFLYISDVGNDKSKVYVDNSTYLATKTLDIDIDIDEYLASTYLSGDIMDASVTYGGACCDKRKGGSGSTDVTVNHENMMVGSFNSASGISIAGQNVGNNSLVQQTTSTNAVLMGSGDVVSPGGGGHGHGGY